MEQKNRKGKIIKFSLLGALAVLVVVLGVMVWQTMPVYSAFEKPAQSVSELREILAEGDSSKDYVVPDPSIFGAEPDEILVKLAGRNRNALPNGYMLSCRDAKSPEFKTWGVVGMLAKNTTWSVGSDYRNHLCNLKIGEQPKGDRYLTLELLAEEYVYSIGIVYDPTGLSQEQQDQREEDLQKYLYAAADQIIDRNNS